MAENFNINTTQDQSLIAGGLDVNSPATSYVDFAQKIADNATRQKMQEAQVTQAIEQAKQSKLATKQKTSADEAGVNPELDDYLTKQEALTYLMHEWNVKENDPEIKQLNEVLPEMVNRFTIQTLLRKRSMGLGKEIGQPFKAEAKGVYPSTLDKLGEPAALEAGQMYQAYVTEDGKINYVTSGAGKYGGTNTSTFKPVGITAAGETVSPTRTGQLIVVGKDGNSRPWDAAADGELQPFIAPTLPGSSMQDLQRLQTSVEQFNNIRNLFTEDAVGPVQDRLITLSNNTGVDFAGLFNESGAFDAKNTTFRTALQAAINDYIKAVTGAQMSEAEASRLQKAIPSAGKAQEAFLPTLEAANKIIENKLSIELDTLEAGGYRNVAGIRSKFKERTEKGRTPKKEEGKSNATEDKKAALRKKLGI